MEELEIMALIVTYFIIKAVKPTYDSRYDTRMTFTIRLITFALFTYGILLFMFNTLHTH